MRIRMCSRKYRGDIRSFSAKSGKCACCFNGALPEKMKKSGGADADSRRLPTHPPEMSSRGYLLRHMWIHANQH